jgi:hypothetical protein
MMVSVKAIFVSKQGYRVAPGSLSPGYHVSPPELESRGGL